MSNDHNYKEVTSTTLDKQKLEELIARLSVDSDEEFVGAGQRAVNPERAIQFILEKEKKLKELEKSFKTLLNQIKGDIAKLETQLSDLLEQRAEILQEISAIEDNMPKNEDGSLNWEEIAGQEGIKPKDGETPDEFKKRAIKELQAKKDNGDLDPNSYISLWLDANNRLNDVDDRIEVTRDELDDVRELKGNSKKMVKNFENLHISTEEKINIPTEMEALKEKIENDPKNPELLQELIDLEDKIENLSRQIEELSHELKEIELAGEKRHENGNTYTQLLKNNSIEDMELVLESAGVSKEEGLWANEEFDDLMDDFGDEFSTEENQIVIEDELLKNPIPDPTGGSLTAQVNAAFNPDQREIPSPATEPEKAPVTTFGLG